MDDNVMRKYTTRSDEARHYVQYDQGEHLIFYRKIAKDFIFNLFLIRRGPMALYTSSPERISCRIFSCF